MKHDNTSKVLDSVINSLIDFDDENAMIESKRANDNNFLKCKCGKFIVQYNPYNGTDDGDFYLIYDDLMYTILEYNYSIEPSYIHVSLPNCDRLPVPFDEEEMFHYSLSYDFNGVDISIFNKIIEIRNYLRILYKKLDVAGKTI